MKARTIGAVLAATLLLAGTGLVMAGIIGTHKFSYDVWGDAVNLAARLMARAEPGTMLVSDATLDACGTEVARTAVDPFFVKGKRNAVHAAFVTGRAPRAQRTPHDVLPFERHGRALRVVLVVPAGRSVAGSSDDRGEVAVQPGNTPQSLTAIGIQPRSGQFQVRFFHRLRS